MIRNWIVMKNRIDEKAACNQLPCVCIGEAHIPRSLFSVRAAGVCPGTPSGKVYMVSKTSSNGWSLNRQLYFAGSQPEDGTPHRLLQQAMPCEKTSEGCDSCENCISPWPGANLP